METETDSQPVTKILGLNIFYLAVLICSILLYSLVRTYPERSALVPSLVILLTAALCALGISLQTRTYFTKRPKREEDETQSIIRTEVQTLLALVRTEITNTPVPRVVLFLLLVPIYASMIGVLGIFTATFCLAAFFTYSNTRSPLKALLTATLLVFFLYYVFVDLFNFTLLVREDVVLYELESLVL